MLYEKGIETLKRNLEEYLVTKILWNDLIHLAVVVLENNYLEFENKKKNSIIPSD